MLAAPRTAEAMLVEGGRIVALGSHREVVRQKATGTPRTDLGGRLVVPGLIDAHVHLADCLWAREGLDLRGAGSAGEWAERYEAWSRSHQEGPVVGGGWDHERWADRRYPTREEVDRAIPDRPAVLYRSCLHVAVLNSAALDELGLDRSTSPPPGGSFGGREDGELDGLLFENALRIARPLVQTFVRAHRDRMESLLAAAAACGLTTLASMSAEEREIDAVRASFRGRPLPVRLRFYLAEHEQGRYRRIASSLRGSRLRLAGVKLVADGSFGARSAWLEEPYADDLGNRGTPLYDTESLEHALGEAADAGRPAAVHAIGDRALREVLEAFHKIPSRAGRRIEHASLVPPSLHPLLRKLRPAIIVQPGFVASDTWLPDRLGAARARHAYPFRTLLRLGLVVAGSSDAPVEHLDPWSGMRAATRRPPVAAQGRPPPSERLTVPEALQLYTAAGGEALGEAGLGRLVVGGPADFAILRGSRLGPLLGSASRPVLETWCGGDRTFAEAATSATGRR